MRETGVVIGLLALFVLVGVARSIPWHVLLEYGQQMMLGAAAVGIPLELVYFLLLGGALWHSGDPPRGWYWRSFEHHHRIEPAMRWLVLPPFYLGALAFLVITLGISVVVLALIMAAMG